MDRAQRKVSAAASGPRAGREPSWRAVRAQMHVWILERPHLFTDLVVLDS